MSWVTVVWSMMASACLTLALIHSLVWGRNRGAWASLLYAVAAVAAAAYAFCELWMLHAQTPAEISMALRWAHVPIWLLMVALAGFVRLYLRAGRTWLMWSFIGLRTVALLLNFVTGQNLNFLETTALPQLPLLGEPVSVLVGVANPWMPVGSLSLLLLVIFVADASVTAWRRGERRQALLVGGSIVLFVLAGAGQAMLITWVGVQVPAMVSLFHLAIVAAMGYELSHDVLRASQLVGELQSSEAELRESEQRMALAAESANLGLWVWEIAPDQIWATPRCRAMFGFDPQQQLALADFTDRLHPDDRDLTARHIRSTLEEGVPYEVHYRVRRPDGTERWIAATGRVDHAASGKAWKMHGVCIDITELRRAEGEAGHLRQEIAHVGRVSMMGQLAAALAHEINQPLGAILRNAEAAALFLQHPSPDLDEIRAIVADIRDDDLRAGSVIDRMRALLKRHELKTQALGVGELLADVWALVRADCAARQVKLEIADAPSDLPTVRGDRVHVQQVLLNLVFNGMDALGGSVPAERRISISVSQADAQYVEIAVTDTGPGIPADKVAQIFDPFFTTKPTGIGMGLAISRTIIEAHGGRLWAENRSGGGASFRFTLPIAA